MKKVLFAFVVASALTACGGGASTATATTDSTKVDSTKIVDSSKLATDTAKVIVDSTKKDSTKMVADTTKK